MKIRSMGSVAFVVALLLGLMAAPVNAGHGPVTGEVVVSPESGSFYQGQTVAVFVGTKDVDADNHVLLLGAGAASGPGGLTDPTAVCAALLGETQCTALITATVNVPVADGDATFFEDDLTILGDAPLGTYSLNYVLADQTAPAIVDTGTVVIEVVELAATDVGEPYEPGHPAADQAGQCAPAEGAVKYNTGKSYDEIVLIGDDLVRVVVDGDTVTFTDPLTGDPVVVSAFCVKAANLNSGTVGGSSYSTSDHAGEGDAFGDHPGEGGPDISNLVIYVPDDVPVPTNGGGNGGTTTTTTEEEEEVEEEVEVLAEVIEEEEEVEVLAELPRTGLATLLLALMGAAAIGTGSVMVRSRR